jgi:MFS_1 like family
MRASLGIVATPFAYLLVVICCTEACGGPAFVMSDTAIVAASLNDGDYGRCRFWACLAWGLAGATCGPLMGWLGIPAVFIAYACVSVIAVCAAWRLDFGFVNNDTKSQLEKLAGAASPASDPENDHIPALSEGDYKQHEGHAARDVLAAEPAADAALQSESGPPFDLYGATHSQSSSDAQHFHTAHSALDADGIAEPLLPTRSGAAAAAAAADDAPFWHKYGQLLKHPKMLLFLSKALIMGVRCAMQTD